MNENNAQERGRAKIRCATLEDYDDVFSVWREAGLAVSLRGRERRDPFLRQLAMFPNSYLVATLSDELVGVVLGTHDGRKGWINRLSVRPSYQRCGIASELVERCEEAIRRDGTDIVAALIDPRNSASGAIFEKPGYETDVPAVYYRKRTNARV